MKSNNYKKKQLLTKQRKDSLKKYDRDKILEQYQIEKNMKKNRFLFSVLRNSKLIISFQQRFIVTD
jgi:hypothetical protein